MGLIGPMGPIGPIALMIADHRLQAREKVNLPSFAADCDQRPLSVAKLAGRVFFSLLLSNHAFSLVDRQFRRYPNAGICNPFAHDTPSHALSP